MSYGCPIKDNKYSKYKNKHEDLFDIYLKLSYFPLQKGFQVNQSKY